MNKYKVHGEYTISFDVDIIAEDEEDAISKAEDIKFSETINNCIMSESVDGEEPTLNADGMIDNVTAELIEKNIKEED